MSKEIGFHHGALCDPYEQQANDQGYTLGDYLKYKGKGKVYGWRIADYKLYNKPMEVSDFRFHGCTDRVKKPPQSIVYVNELEG